MFKTFRDHAAPYASLTFTSGISHGEAIGAFEGKPLDHASLAPTEYQTLLGDNGFSVTAHTIEDPACDQRTVWLAKSAT